MASFYGSKLQGFCPHNTKPCTFNPTKSYCYQIDSTRYELFRTTTYVKNSDARIVDYCTRKAEGKRLVTSLVEGAADFIVNARMAKSQHMRWTTKGAYNLLQVRTANINDRLAEAKQVA